MTMGPRQPLDTTYVHWAVVVMLVYAALITVAIAAQA